MMQILVEVVAIDLAVFTKRSLCLWPKLTMEHWDRRGDVRLDVRLNSGGVVEEARGVVGGIDVVYLELPGGASGTGGMVSRCECCACPGHLHCTCVAGRHGLCIDCSSWDRRMGWR